MSRRALIAYEKERRPATSRIVVANRGNGPDQIMQVVEEKCQGMFDTITDVMSAGELAGHAARYKALAGLDRESLNARPPLIAAGDRVRGGVQDGPDV